MTGAVNRSAIVAALFALHPLRVESVAWASERKDVLCIFFTLAAMLAYVSGRRAWITFVLYLFALMSKPNAMALPLLLLLIDFWPLNRLTRATLWARVREKIPLFALAAIVGVLTVKAQHGVASVTDNAHFPIVQKALNVSLTYLFYLYKSVWPLSLGIDYAYGIIPVWQGLLGWAAILAISWFAFQVRASRPWITFGWIWWLVTIGQTLTIYGRLDRFTYLPSVGLLVAIVWTLSFPRKVAVTAVAAVLIAFSVLTFLQIQVWRDQFTLYEHAVEVYDGDKVTQNNYGGLLMNLGRIDQAIVHFEKAVALDPKFTTGLENLGNAYFRQGNLEKARQNLALAARYDPSLPDASFYLGMTLVQLGRADEARAAFQSALRIGLRPDVAARAHAQIGEIFLKERKPEDAIPEFQQAVDLDPKWIEARKYFGGVLARAGQTQQAVAQFSKVLEISPTDHDAQKALELLRLPQKP
jgi:Tfp pilus assembly protein PilF